MKFRFVLFFAIFLVVTFSFVSADIISINSGGSRDLILNPDSLIENFFFSSNNLPVASNLVLFSSLGTNTTNENLSISYDSYDSDGDPITNITDWRVNGNSMAVLNMPFDKRVLELTSGAIRDYSSYGNNGTLGGGSMAYSPTWNEFCQVGGCYSFDGVDDYVDVEDITLDILNSNYTLSFWNYVPSGNDGFWEGLIGGDISGTDGGYWLYHGNSLAFYQDYYSKTYLWYSSLSLGDEIPFDTWSFITIVSYPHNSTHSYLTVYANGGESSQSKIFENSPRPVTTFKIEVIGRRGSSGSNFNGSIDEVMIFDRALSQEQIQEIYQAGLAGHQLEDVVSQESDLGDVWQVALTPNDIIADGVTIYSNTLEIINSPPENPSDVTLVSVDGSNESDANLNCSAYVEDFDDTVFDVYINWIKDDISVLNQTFVNENNETTVSYTLLSGNLTLGDVWYCSVRVYDGAAYSSWSDSNELEIIDQTNPEVYIISPLSNEDYNYTDLGVDFNISIIENENISRCFYSLEGATNVSMIEINDSYFWYEPSLGPGPQTVEFYCNDTSGNWGYNSTTFEILDSAAISVDLSEELSWSVKWNLTYLPVNDFGAIGNNGSGITKYYLNISATSTTVDLYVRADGDLQTIALDTLGLGNETFTYTVNEPTVNNNTNATMSTSYVNIGSGLGDGDVVYLKFFIDAPSAQPAGFYENQLQFKAVRNGVSA